MSVTTESRQRAARLTRDSLLMLPVFGAIFIATSFIGEYVVLGLLGLNEGDLWLMERGIAGWTAEILFTLVLVSAPVAGAWLAATAAGGAPGSGSS